MFTVVTLVLVAAFATCITSAMSPPWVPTLLLCIAGLLVYLPVGK